MRLAWGKKVSAEFARRAIEVANEIGVPPDHLMSCMAFESGETFSASVLNRASGATGLIQFMRPTAKGLGTTTADLAKMTAVEQLDYVSAYFKPYRGKLKNISDLYMAILWPAAVGKPDSYVLFDEAVDKTHKAYIQNKGLDVNKNGQVTKAEAAAQPLAKLRKGLGAAYAATIPADGEPEDEPSPIPIPRTRPDDAPETGRAWAADVRTVQTALKGMNYYTGRLDGLWGGKTAAAIAAFLNDWEERDGDIPPPKSEAKFTEIADDLKREIGYAVTEEFVRPVTKERADADPEVIKEVAPEVVQQKRGVIATVWAAIVAAVSGVVNSVSGYVGSAWNWITGNRDQLPDAVSDPGWLSWGFGKLQSIPPSVWLFVGAGVLAFVAFGLINTVKQTVDDVRTGKR